MSRGLVSGVNCQSFGVSQMSIKIVLTLYFLFIVKSSYKTYVNLV